MYMIILHHKTGIPRSIKLCLDCSSSLFKRYSCTIFLGISIFSLRILLWICCAASINKTSKCNFGFFAFLTYSFDCLFFCSFILSSLVVILKK